MAICSPSYKEHNPSFQDSIRRETLMKGINDCYSKCFPCGEYLP